MSMSDLIECPQCGTVLPTPDNRCPSCKNFLDPLTSKRISTRAPVEEAAEGTGDAPLPPSFRKEPPPQRVGAVLFPGEVSRPQWPRHEPPKGHVATTCAALSEGAALLLTRVDAENRGMAQLLFLAISVLIVLAFIFAIVGLRRSRGRLGLQIVAALVLLLAAAQLIFSFIPVD